MTVNPEGLVIGHRASSLVSAEEYLKLSGAEKESARVQTIRMNKEGWKKSEEFEDPTELSLLATQIGLDLFMQNNPQIRIPLPPTPKELIFPNAHDDLNPIVKEDLRRTLMRPASHYNRKHINAKIQQELTKGLARPTRDFNKRLAEALKLKDPEEVDTSTKLGLPVSPGQLDLADLGPDEDWREFEADYRISRRGAYWYIGEGQYSTGEISTWLSKMGYKRAAELAGASGTANNALMHELEKVNLHLAAELEARVMALNPSLVSKSENVQMMPLKESTPRPLSSREMADQ